MLKDGEKGAVLQRDKESYAIVPHFPLGLADPQILRNIADVAEKYGAALKITSASRIAIVGLKEEDIDSAWEQIGTDPGAAVGACVRSVKACPGSTFCRLGKQDSIALAQELDKRYHGFSLPAKFKMGVSGCINQCAENCIKDLAFTGKADGWVIQVGGNGGSRPALAQELVSGVSTEDALEITERILTFYKDHAKKMDRMSRVISREGIDSLKKAVLG